MDGRDLLLLVGVLLVSGAGAILGSYLREKGRNIATKEDLQEITRKVEEVKTEIRGGLWIDQERWSFKRDIYRSLLEGLFGMTGALYKIAHARPLDAASRDHPSWKDLNIASKQFVDAFVLARVFLSASAIVDLEKLNLEAQAVTGSTDVAGQARLANLSQTLSNATLRLTAIAKEDLKFRDK